MNTPLTIFRTATLALLLAANTVAFGDSSKSQAAAKATATAQNGFGLRLLRALDKAQPDGNVFISPASIGAALAMTLNGAGGETQKQMAAALGFDGQSIQSVDDGYKALIPAITQNGSDVQVSMANGLWADRSTTLNPDFQRRCADAFSATSKTLDFHSPAAAGTINHWVSDATHGKITQLVSPSDTSASNIILTNASYFHGKWMSPFSADATRPMPFFSDNGTQSKVPMMYQTEDIGYDEDSGYQIAALPYGGDGRFCMVIVLPKASTTLTPLMAHLNDKTWPEMLSGIEQRTVDIYLPKFSANTRLSLKPALSATGLGEMFSPSADFAKMSSTNDCVGQVLHVARLDVDEKGTVAAAATSVGMMASAMPQMEAPPVLRVDHPFLCAIYDQKTGAILFLGIIRHPGAE
jgi:serine protease inhibitor